MIKENINSDMKHWKNKWKLAAERLDKRKDKWKKIVENAPLMHDFLKENYY